MHKKFLQTGAALGFVAIALGAFGAHTLKAHVSEQAVNIFETGVRYQCYHAIALILTGILYKEFPNKFIVWAGRLFTTGIILFSGSLYLLTYLKGFHVQGYDWTGIVTPVGGLAFLSGWLCLLRGLSALSLPAHGYDNKKKEGS